MILKNEVTIFGKQFSLILRVFPEKTVITGGFGNRCKNAEYILFLDHDDTPEHWIREELKLLQKNFPLGNAYLFRTKRGHHTIFLEKFPLCDITEMMLVTSCDAHYKSIPMFYGRRMWVLRSLEKKNETIKYLGVIKNHSDIERSLAHKEYLKNIYKVPEKDFAGNGKFDKEKDLTLAYYKISEKNN